MKLPATMDSTIPEIFRHRLLADFTNAVLRQGRFVKTKPPVVGGKEDNAVPSHELVDALQQFHVLLLHVPVTTRAFAVGTGRWIDHRQIEAAVGLAASRLQVLKDIAGNETVLHALQAIQLHVLQGPRQVIA
jgi:hypothetical protein